jgi:hypothetical protein
MRLNILFIISLITGIVFIVSGFFDLLLGESELWISSGSGSALVSSNAYRGDTNFVSFVALKIGIGCFILFLIYQFREK